jgi:hypothetical protein
MAGSAGPKRGWRERRAEKRRQKELRTGPSPESLAEKQKQKGNADVKDAADAASVRIVGGGG